MTKFAAMLAHARTTAPLARIVLRLRGGMQIFVKTLTGKTITLDVGRPPHLTCPAPVPRSSPRCACTHSPRPHQARPRPPPRRTSPRRCSCRLNSPRPQRHNRAHQQAPRRTNTGARMLAHPRGVHMPAQAQLRPPCCHQHTSNQPPTKPNNTTTAPASSTRLILPPARQTSTCNAAEEAGVQQPDNQDGPQHRPRRRHQERHARVLLRGLLRAHDHPVGHQVRADRSPCATRRRTCSPAVDRWRHGRQLSPT